MKLLSLRGILLAAFLVNLNACATHLMQQDVSVTSAEAAQLVKEAAALYERGDYADALNTLSAAEQKTHTSADKRKIADIITHDGQRLLGERRYLDATSYYRASLRINSVLDNKAGLINDYSNLGKISAELGKIVEATELFERALQVQKKTADDTGQARNLNNLANLYSILGNYQQSRSLLDQALSLARKREAVRLETTTLINLGALLYNLRDYRNAAEHLSDALHIAERENEQKLEALAYTVLGAVYRQQSDFEQALEYYQAALTINERLKLRSETATSVRTLGELYLYRVEGDKEQNLQKAHQYLERALSIHDSQRDALGAAMTTSHLGEYYYQRKQYDEALREFEIARDHFESIKFPDGVGRTFIFTGRARGDMDQLSTAISDFDQAIRIYEGLGDREWTRVALFRRALYLEKSGDFPAAEESYKKSIEIFESIRSGVAGGEEAQELFTKVNVEVYENLVALLVSKGDIEGALEYVERSRLRALRDYMLNTRTNSSHVRGGNDLDQLNELSRANDSLAKTSRSAEDPETRGHAATSLAENQQQALKIVSRLNRRYPGIATTLGVVPNTREFRRSADFPDDLAIVTYFVTAETLYVFVAKKGQRVAVKSLPISRQELRNRVIEALTLISSRSGPIRPDTDRGVVAVDPETGKGELKHVLQELYRNLVEPIDEDLKDVQTVAVLPFDYLSYLPFEALVTTDTDGDDLFFVQRKHIVYLANQTYTNNFIELLKRQPHEPIGSVVAFGNPTTGNEEDTLPYAQIEVSKIKDFFPDSLVFMTDQATKKNFIAHWGKHQILHIAAHARLTENGSEILLAPGVTGTLTMDEMFDLDANESTRFIALSACQTGVDPIISGESSPAAVPGEPEPIPPGIPLASTVHTFSLVGVPSILATLWNIDDRATAILMTYFYENLQQGQSFYPALRKAQLSMVERDDAFSQPYYWAAFVFYGFGG